MARLISVEPGLETIKQHLSNRGYEVVDAETWVRPVEAVIYSGQSLTADSGRQPAAQNTVLVNAAGLTPEEVAAQLENRLN